ncbi:Uncharacterised protein [Enterobacter cloacae]|nr:Uncharacterised protein [Enterobacter cloacae]
MYSSLFMTNQNMINTAYRVQRVINIENRASGIAEHLFHALIDKRSDDHFRARQHLHALPPGFCYRRSTEFISAPSSDRVNPSYNVQSDGYLNRSL